MIGFIRSSSRFFRDRRILLGSFMAVILAYISVLWIYGSIGFESAFYQNKGVFIVLTGMFWPAIWGCVIGSILPKEEHRQGSLELLLATPISPKRLVFAMSFAPIIIATTVMTAVFPAMFFCISVHQDAVMVFQAVLTGTIMLPLVWLVFVFCVWTGASKSQETPVSSKQIFLTTFIFVVAFILLGGLWGRASPVVTFILGGYATIYLLISMFITFYRVTPFSLEDMESQADPITTRISTLLAFLRSHEGTIFEREEGVSKYETMEEIRQQTLGGPLLLVQNVRDVAFTGLFLISPFLLIFGMIPGFIILPFLRYSAAFILLLSLLFTAGVAMRDMLSERSTLRLDSIRTSLLPLSEVTRVREWVAIVLPYTAMKWCLGFGLIWGMICFFSFYMFFMMVLFAVQGWLALMLASRLGLCLGLLIRDEMEGALWIVLLFFVWLFAPYIGLVILPHYVEMSTLPFAVQSIAAVSPLYMILSLSKQLYQFSSFLVIASGLGFQSICILASGWYNQRTIGSAWYK